MEAAQDLELCKGLIPEARYGDTVTCQEVHGELPDMEKRTKLRHLETQSKDNQSSFASE